MRRGGLDMAFIISHAKYNPDTAPAARRRAGAVTRRWNPAVRRRVSRAQGVFGDDGGLEHDRTSSMASPSPAPAAGFSPYQKFVVGLLALLQFAVILDFMLMAPLGALIMPALAITPKQFGLVVSAYAFSAGVSGFVTAGFADRF